MKSQKSIIILHVLFSTKLVFLTKFLSSMLLTFWAVIFVHIYSLISLVEEETEMESVYILRMSNLFPFMYIFSLEWIELKRKEGIYILFYLQ